MAVYAGTELVSGGIFEELGHINDKNNPHEVNAGQVAYGDTTVSAQLSSIASEMSDLKNSVSNGKAQVASAITSKGQTTASNASFADMAANIDKIKLGSGNAVASQVLSDITFSNSSGEELTGTMPNRGAVQGAITVASNSTIGTAGTAYYTIPAGYHDGSGVARVTSIVNLASANIKTGVTIGGITGTYANDATAAAGDILASKTAYVGSQKITGTIATKSAANLSASGSVVTVPAGYYASQVTKNVSAGSATVSGLSIANTTGIVTATGSVTAGYVSAASPTKTLQLTSQAAQTITPGTSDKTIASYRWLTGTQTIKGDANLTAANIKSGVTIFGVTGNLNAASFLPYPMSSSVRSISVTTPVGQSSSSFTISATLPSSTSLVVMAMINMNITSHSMSFAMDVGSNSEYTLINYFKTGSYSVSSTRYVQTSPYPEITASFTRVPNTTNFSIKIQADKAYTFGNCYTYIYYY